MKAKNLFLNLERELIITMMVFDAHTHVFPPEIIEKRELIAEKDRRFAVIYADRRARMADGSRLLQYVEDEGIDAAATMSFPFADNGLNRIANDYVLELAKQDARIIPFVVVDTREEGAAFTEAQRCIDKGARGVGELAYYESGFDERKRKELEGLAHFLEEKQSILIMHLNEQVGHRYPGKIHADFEEVVRLVEGVPTLRIVLAHLGGGICFYEFMPEIRKTFSRVYYDLAAVPLLYEQALYTFCESFLKEKVLFGSDFPLLTLARYQPGIKRLGEKAQEHFLYRNARSLFGD